MDSMNWPIPASSASDSRATSQSGASGARSSRRLDERLLAALAAGLPDCAGVALGFDRLVAIGLGATALAPAMAFPIENA